MPFVVAGVALAVCLALRRSRPMPRRRGEEGASYVLAVLLIAAVTIALAWSAKDTLFKTQQKTSDRIETETNQFGK